jgi:hypothetical protein
MNPNFKVIKNSELEYRGEVTEDVAMHAFDESKLSMNKWIWQGSGIAIYNDGRVYEGDWNGDKRYGMGYEAFANGNVFRG